MPKQETQLGGVGSREPELRNEQLFSLWVEQQLNEPQRREFEQRCLEDHSFAKQVETCNMFSMHSEHYQSAEVPNWDRAGSFDMPDNVRCCQWQGLQRYLLPSLCWLL
jgi:hypothetical protein